MEATIGFRPSYTWRSLSSAINLVKDGTIWRIANGEDVMIWQDKWIPTTESGYLRSPVKSLSINAKVSELIDPGTKWWNLQMLKNILWEEDVQQIVRIPVAQTNISRDKRVEETPAHVLWDCPSAQDVWMLGSKKFQKAAFTHKEFGEIFMHMFQRLGNSEISLFAEITKMLWMRRNKLIFEDSFTTPSILMMRATQEFNDFQQLCTKQLNSRNHDRMAQTDLVYWQPPDTDWIKINWDVAVRERGNRLGVGIVVRDSEGDILASYMQPLHFCSQAEIAEARGLISAVKLCKELSLQRVIFEGDSLQVVNAVKQNAQSYGMLQCTVNDVYLILAGITWKISHVKRDANQVAHLLAQKALLQSCELMDVDCINPDITDLVLAEKHRAGFGTSGFAAAQSHFNVINFCHEQLVSNLALLDLNAVNYGSGEYAPDFFIVMAEGHSIS
ncbi:uncharacterized protein LOC121246799 [Juglans microcarpa x Juglans regia]|uniref:uncharacterized protein LOC121246799 n=1 Tax=Juglans microcarpa x Juglans regia TaxID=2249226 RepID=UPI001B7E7B3C|nr:uncharacterized protein LOC121246799 [Juglans microcarpa x Juglans regia]